MKHLIDKEKFLAEIRPYWTGRLQRAFSKHTKEMKDEPHHPSGMDHHDINVRNALRKELRGGD